MDCTNMEQQRHKMLQKAISIRNRIDKLIHDNKNRNSIESLSNEEFVLDKEQETIFSNDCTERLAETRLNIKLENDQNNMLAVRIRQEFYDAMRFHACDIQTLSTPLLSASNIPMRDISKEEERELLIIRHLRLAEIYDIKRSTSQTLKSGLCWINCLDVTEAGNLIPSLGVDSSMEISAQSMDKEYLDDIYEVNEKSPSRSLLYSPLAVKTDAQRRIQIILLKDVIRSIAIDFNIKFQNIRNDKANAVRRINCINDRLKEIADMLKIKEEIIDIIPLSDKESPESLLYINGNGSQINNEELTKKNNIISASQHDPLTRAIADMMDGTLDEKKTITVFEIKRKPWMNKLKKEEMTSRQRREIEEYENKTKEAQAAAEEQHKTLNIEMKRLITEAQDLTSGFDEKVKKLVNDKRDVQTMFTMLELYILHIAYASFIYEDSYKSVGELHEEHSSLNKNRERFIVISKKIQDELRTLKTEFTKLSEEDKAMERSFRKNIQLSSPLPLDQETVKTLFELYNKRNECDRLEKKISTHKGKDKRRSSIRRASGRKGSLSIPSTSGRSGSAAGSFSSHDNSNTLTTLEIIETKEPNSLTNGIKFVSKNDPFLIAYEKPKQFEMVEEVALSKTDIPEGFNGSISDPVWNELQNLRNEKIKKELDVSKASAAYKKVKKVYERRKIQEGSISSSIDEITSQIKNTENCRLQMMNNPVLLISIKQGQDELEKEALLTNYDDSLLIPMSIIHNANELISSMGQEKKIMYDKMKTLHKNINMLSWNHDYLHMKEYCVRELYTDFQFLRVTNQLKSVILGEESDESNRLKAKRAEEQQLKRQEILNAKLFKLEKEKLKLEKMIKVRGTDTCKLINQLDELRNAINSREEIYENKQKNDDKKKQMKEKFLSIKKIWCHHKLVSSQGDEIKLLTEELMRLRKKTFPIFDINE